MLPLKNQTYCTYGIAPKSCPLVKCPNVVKVLGSMVAREVDLRQAHVPVANNALHPNLLI